MTDESVFAAALALPATDRAAYLDRECAGNADLRRDVEALLAAHAAGNPLDRPADLAPTGGYSPAAAAGPTRAVGDRIGPYKLMEPIGEGGMGEVWVADQLEPIRRRVALKVIKPGMDSRSVLARFEAERQALALMDHPNIARVLDAGTTADGRPYFVMELVKGIPITDFCDARKLSARERLELFVPVCQAIQHAHTKGVIHRDVKPSNVLVELHDDRPVPKVIDFGVAKAVGQQLTEKTIYTGLGALVGTPAYMAPEQASFNALDVDTRADVYALGVLLYELLAGSPPFEPERLKKAAFDEVLRMVREEEPPRPSARLSTSEARASIAAVRQSDPAKLSRLVRGELDWIVMKAIEKDRSRRYDTANGLARDVQRYLGGDAVEACPPTLRYRLHKLLRRNRGVVLVSSVVVAALLTGTGVSWWQADRARSAERLASAQLDRALGAEDRALNALNAEKDARDEIERQLSRVKRAEAESARALRRSEGLRLATTALLKKPQSHDLAGALAHEAVSVSGDPATVGTALAAVQGLPNPKPFAAAAINHPRIPADNFVPFLPSDWVRYHPDGRHVLALNNEHTAVVTFDAATLKPVRTLSLRTAGQSELAHLAFDPRGRWLVGIDDEAGLTAWDAAAGTEAGRASLAGSGVWAAEFSPARDLLAVIGPKGGTETTGEQINPHRLVVFGLPGFDRRFEFEAPELFRAVAFSRDGSQVALSSAGQRVIRVWDLSTKALRMEVREPDKLPWPALVFSHDGMKLLDVVRDGMAIWDIAAKKKDLVRRDDGANTTNGAGISVDADGATLLVQPSFVRATLHSQHAVGDTAPLRVFDLKQLRWGPVLTHDPPADMLRSELSADGRRAVGLFGHHGLVAWDVATGVRVLRVPIPGDTTEGLAVSPDGRSAVTNGSGGRLRRWDFDDRGVLPSVEFQWAKDHALVCDAGRRVVVFRGDGRLETLDAATLRPLDLGPPKRFPWTQDGHTLVRVLADGRRVLMVNDRKSEAVLYTAAAEEVARYPGLANVDVLNQGRRRVLTTPEGGIRFLLPVAKGNGPEIVFRAYDAETGKLVSTIDLGGGATGAWHYALTADGRRLAVVPDRPRPAGPRDLGVEVWDLDTGTREGKAPAGERYMDGGEAFGWGGTRLVTWRVGRAAVWDAATRERLREFRLYDESIRHAALSANGKLLATDTKTELALWDADTGANLYRLAHPDVSCDGIAFVANDSMLMVDSARGGWSALDLFPTDAAAHFRGLGLRRLTDGERKEYGLQARPGRPAGDTRAGVVN